MIIIDILLWVSETIHFVKLYIALLKKHHMFCLIICIEKIRFTHSTSKERNFETICLFQYTQNNADN